MSLKKLVLFLIVAFVACSFAVDDAQEIPMDGNLEELDYEVDLERNEPLNELDVQEETLLDPEVQSVERTEDNLEVQGEEEPTPDGEPAGGPIGPIGCPLIRRCGLSCCNPGQFCQDNRCVSRCAAFRPTCGRRCCRINQVCRNGVCSSCPQNSPVCAGRCCPVGTFCSGGRCLCPATRRCGNSCCRSGQFCDTSRNVCVNRCPPTLSICAGRCCRNNEQCSNGVCVRCPNNRLACNGTCCRNDQVCRNRRCECRTIECGGVCCGGNQLCLNSQCIPRQRCHIQQQCGRNCCSTTQNCDRSVPTIPRCIISPPRCTFNQYVGFTQTQWGAVCGRFQPAPCFLENNFGTCFPGGYMIGCQPNQGNSIRWTNVTSLQQFLPQGGPNTELQASYINPGQFVNNTASRRAAGAFGGNVAALGLTIGFDDCNQVNFSRGCDPVKNLFVCDRGQAYFRNRRCNLYFGLTINEIFQLATRALGSCCRAVPQRRCNVNNLNPCLNAINFAFQGEQNLVTRFPNNEFSKVRCPTS